MTLIFMHRAEVQGRARPRLRGRHTRPASYERIAGLPIIGVLGCMMALGLGVALSSQRDTLIYLSVLLGLYGLATESILASSGVIRYGAQGPFSEIAPVWIVTLWMAFSVLIF